MKPRDAKAWNLLGLSCFPSHRTSSLAWKKGVRREKINRAFPELARQLGKLSAYYYAALTCHNHFHSKDTLPAVETKNAWLILTTCANLLMEISNSFLWIGVSSTVWRESSRYQAGTLLTSTRPCLHKAWATAGNHMVLTGTAASWDLIYHTLHVWKRRTTSQDDADQWEGEVGGVLRSQASPESWGDEQTLEATPPVISLASDHRALRWGDELPFYRWKLKLREVRPLGEGNTTASD